MSDSESELEFDGYQLHDAAEKGDVEQIYSLLVPHNKGERGGGGDEAPGSENEGGIEGDKAPDSVEEGKQDELSPQNEEMKVDKTREDSGDDDEDFNPYEMIPDIDGRDRDGATPLHVALYNFELSAVTTLLDLGANGGKKWEGSTPAHLAICLGGVAKDEDFALSVLKAILLHQNAEGLDLTSSKDDRGQTLLHVAATFGFCSCLRFLLDVPQVKDLVNMRERGGLRPLHMSAVNGHVVVTKLLLEAGAEVNMVSALGATPLHMASMRGQWDVARELLRASSDSSALDKRGLTPGQYVAKFGLKPPGDVIQLLGLSNGEANSVSDDDKPLQFSTRVYHHKICVRHHSCPPILRLGPNPPPENVNRLHTLLDEKKGVLRSPEFDALQWDENAPLAAMADVLRVHEYSYVSHIQSICKRLKKESLSYGMMGDCGAVPEVGLITYLDGDTGISSDSFEAALRAAGAVCRAVDDVCSGAVKNAFCAVRPPGHHAGVRGLVKGNNESTGSHGFCLLNNVAIGAAYARHVYRHRGIKKVAIVDFDVHHGNGTEEIVRAVIPGMESVPLNLPFCTGVVCRPRYMPWLDEDDAKSCFFISVHGHGTTGNHGCFFPGSGSTEVPNQDAAHHVGNEFVEEINPLVYNFGVTLPSSDDIPGHNRVHWRDLWRLKAFPALVNFNPDLILISAGFDAHKKDSINCGYIGLIEEDYEWITAQLVAIANSCCSGRIISALEGGYQIQGGPISSFGRSTAAHVRTLLEGSRTTFPKWSMEDAKWESEYEEQVLIERERRKRLKMEQKLLHDKKLQQTVEGGGEELGKPSHLAVLQSSCADVNGDGSTIINLEDTAAPPAAPEMSSVKDESSQPTGNKRNRPPVDYEMLAKQLDLENMERKKGKIG